MTKMTSIISSAGEPDIGVIGGVLDDMKAGSSGLGPGLEGMGRKEILVSVAMRTKMRLMGIEKKRVLLS